MINAVIFDFDGLLVDTEIISYQIYAEILSGFGYTFSMEEYAQAYSGKTEIRNVTHLIETYRLPWTLEEGQKQVSLIEKRLLAQGVALKPGAKELLSFLKQNRCKIALATSSTADRALSILSEHSVVNYFDEFVFAGDIQKGKPDPEGFLKACEKLGEKPENCLILEDSEAGIQAANAAKIAVICIPDMKKPDQQLLKQTAAVLNSLDEVIQYLSEQNR